MAYNDRRPRIEPVQPPYSPEVEAELTKWMPPDSEMEPLLLFRTLAVNTALAEAMRPLGSHLLSRRSGLDRAARELVIARVCARNGCDYEWGVHVVAFAAAAGLSKVQIDATAEVEVDPSLWDDRQRSLLTLVDELHECGRVTEATWVALRSHFSDEQVLTLLVLAGWYAVISFVANGTQVSREPWAPALP